MTQQSYPSKTAINALASLGNSERTLSWLPFTAYKNLPIMGRLSPTLATLDFRPIWGCPDAAHRHAIQTVTNDKINELA
jgi:hypothetical protein